ncbi:hypothetical protein CJF42_23035 [Pseudoalteromonas sp. NBT06-2]|uniref:alpha/beta hydrolase family protein n=1 Tax=Pseudoalteromonas sp. NBT06-2 TaxID=2025950 RepID=UPI000BA57ABC|nr:prolyl oligopeptidase family serine peptidase [Pseudoalteromonas sp. NBT06-2]PAJ72099.1 hypothetical protein CJF42_23035 [Pseudoalteromonas sp. NBT06-2]
MNSIFANNKRKTCSYKRALVQTLTLLITIVFFLSFTSVYASTMLSNLPCVNGQYSLSPCGELLYRICKDDKRNQKSHKEHINTSKFLGEILKTKDYSRIGSAPAPSVNVAWALDGKSFYQAMNTRKASVVAQLSVEKLGGYLPAYFFANPASFTVSAPVTEGRLISTEIMVDGLMSNLGIIPVIERLTVDHYKFIQYGGGYYEYDEVEEERRHIDPEPIKVFESDADSSFQVIKWLYDPYGQPAINVLYSPDTNKLSVKVLKHSRWSKKLNAFSKIELPFKLKIDEFKLFITYEDNVIPNSQNKAWYVSSKDHDTSALYEVDWATGASELLFHEPDFDISRPLYTRRGELLGVEIYKETNQFIPLTEKGKHLNKLINKERPISGHFDTNILSIADNASKVVFEISGNKDKRVYLADLNSNTTQIIADNNISDVSKTIPLWTETSDGGRILSYFTHLTEASNKKTAPLIVNIHGGPFERDKFSKGLYKDELLAKGFNILRVNYRNSNGFGKKLIKPKTIEYQRRVALDVIESLNNALNKMNLAPEKVIAFGLSYGGLVVTDIGTSKDLHKAFDAFISVNGAHNYCELSKRIGFETHQKFTNCTNPIVEKHFEKRNVYHNKPFVIAYGTADQTVLPKQSKNLLSQLKKHSNVKGVSLENESHTISVKALSKLMANF